MQTPGNIIVLGASGQVGRALNQSLEEAVFLGREQADLSKPETLPAILASYNPSIIINAAAYTLVDKAEEEEALATLINADAPLVLARFCAERDIPLIHYSTDYVFDGAGDAPRREDAPVNPLNAYGRSKLKGERNIAESGCKYLIFRTSWVYDAYGKNFVNTMLQLAKSRKELRVVADQHGAPSYAPHLAQATVAALEQALELSQFPSGIYHMCNAGEATWHIFAQAIFVGAKQHGVELAIESVQPITTADYPTPATRPHNSRLDCGKLRSTFAVSLPHWQEGLDECLEILYGSN